MRMYIKREIAFGCLPWGPNFHVNSNWEWGFSTDLQQLGCEQSELCWAWWLGEYYNNV